MLKYRRPRAPRIHSTFPITMKYRRSVAPSPNGALGFSRKDAETNHGDIHSKNTERLTRWSRCISAKTGSKSFLEIQPTSTSVNCSDHDGGHQPCKASVHDLELTDLLVRMKGQQNLPSHGLKEPPDGEASSVITDLSTGSLESSFQTSAQACVKREAADEY